MILFVSGRTDIATYYPKRFYNRVKEGFVDVKNPYNPKLISRIFFKDVDMIIFCSKNIRPLISYLDAIQTLLPDVPFLFHLTITPYNEDIEPKIAPLKNEIIKDINFLSSKYGKEKIFIRYDPILKNKKYNVYYHVKAFKKLLSHIKDSTNNIIVSFVDLYKNTIKNDKEFLHLESFIDKDYKIIGKEFSSLCKHYGINIFTCGEKENLIEYGFNKGSCFDQEFILEILEKHNKFIKISSKNVRNSNNSYCNCLKTVDIGAYNSCLSMCKYCYANYNEKEVIKNYKNHDDNSSLLIGYILNDDIIKVRKN